MMCHRIGLPPISTIGLGRTVVSSLRRVPNPPARMTVFIRPCCRVARSFSPLRYLLWPDAEGESARARVRAPLAGSRAPRTGNACPRGGGPAHPDSRHAAPARALDDRRLPNGHVGA